MMKPDPDNTRRSGKKSWHAAISIEDHVGRGPYATTFNELDVR